MIIMTSEKKITFFKEIEILELSENIFVFIVPKWSVDLLNYIKLKYEQSSKQNAYPKIYVLLSTDKDILDYLIVKYLCKFKPSSNFFLNYKLRAQEYLLYSLCSINKHQKNINNKSNFINVYNVLQNIEFIVNFICKEKESYIIEDNLIAEKLNLYIYNLLTKIYTVVG